MIHLNQRQSSKENVGLCSRKHAFPEVTLKERGYLVFAVDIQNVNICFGADQSYNQFLIHNL